VLEKLLAPLPERVEGVAVALRDCDPAAFMRLGWVNRSTLLQASAIDGRKQQHDATEHTRSLLHCQIKWLLKVK
jgi:hypothetical protein